MNGVITFVVYDDRQVPGRQREIIKVYRRRGWIVLLQRHHFPGVDRPYSILGLDLRRCAWGREMRGTDGIA